MSKVHVVVEDVGPAHDGYDSAVVGVYGGWYKALDLARTAHETRVEHYQKEWVEDGETEPFIAAKCGHLGHYRVTLWEGSKRIKTQRVGS